ncbi:sel1 repeat family protein [Stenotrophomonas tumulicola]|uniref:Sel1 repeat family protein n=1 Tax=Stenotrophomonas tumulicola TaxID=1685415 RepID=A0A7W3II41_9GAMM|nr:sel1 repeat family protein [Stenotrophomonas tumulicola]MBA8682718.1 sel1 repeat family protein [Stenotrophomonas tumulicola]
MKRIKALTISLLAIISAGAAAGLYLSGEKNVNRKTSEADGSPAELKHSQLRATINIQRLANERKISPAIVKPELGRAFSISRSGPLRPPGDALNYAKSLLAASQSGDAVATYDIFLATLDCANHLRNAGIMYQEIGTGESPLKPTSNATEDKENLLECEGLLTSEEFQEKNWLTNAAEQGSLEAMLMYSINPDHVLGDIREYSLKPELVQKWKDDSITYLNRASSAGSTDALYSLSDVYKNGIIAPPNPVEAYAYRLAAHKATGTPIDQRIQSNLTKRLTPHQIQESEGRSEKILTSCCIN